MKQSKIVGVTGGIGSGKSVVSNYLVEKGYSVIDFDKLTIGMYRKNSKIYEDVLNAFGEEILDENNEISRTKLGEKVFSNTEKLKKLNEITHKYIFELAKEAIFKAEKNGDKIIFLDVPLLFETKDKLLQAGIAIDEAWTVYADLEVRIERIKRRDNISIIEIENKIKAQMPIEDKLKLSDEVLLNIGTKKELYDNIDKVIEQKLKNI